MRHKGKTLGRFANIVIKYLLFNRFIGCRFVSAQVSSGQKCPAMSIKDSFVE